MKWSIKYIVSALPFLFTLAPEIGWIWIPPLP